MTDYTTATHSFRRRAKRTNIFTELIKSLFKKQSYIYDVPFTSQLASLFQLHGFTKLFLRLGMKIETDYDSDSNIVTINGRSIHWPLKAPVCRLVDMYFEVFHENSHRFDTHGTMIRENDVVIDAGCCEGYFAMLALEKGASKIYCFEPGRQIISCLNQTFNKDIAKSRIEIVPKLLGDNLCYFDFIEHPEDPTTGHLISKDNCIQNRNSYRVEMTSLDQYYESFGLDRVDYIKIDVEGAEPEVIEGAKHVIARFTPRIAVAVYHDPSHAKKLQEKIFSINNSYLFKLKGVVDFDGVVRPVMLHCFVP